MRVKAVLAIACLFASAALAETAPSAQTKAVQDSFRTTAPFADTRDETFARQGFLGTRKDPVIRTADGRVVFVAEPRTTFVAPGCTVLTGVGGRRNGGNTGGGASRPGNGGAIKGGGVAFAGGGMEAGGADFGWPVCHKIHPNPTANITASMVTPMSIRAATTVIAAVPILMVYPFLQKYFVVGMNVGSIKE